MIILDTNVVSELMKGTSGESLVRKWLDSQATETVYLTATVLAELLVSVQQLPEGKRKQGLAELLRDFVEEVIDDRVLPFDAAAARAYASIVSRTRTLGFPMPLADGQIAATAQVYGFTVATRDTDPFAAAGIAFVNPWELA